MRKSQAFHIASSVHHSFGGRSYALWYPLVAAYLSHRGGSLRFPRPAPSVRLSGARRAHGAVPRDATLQWLAETEVFSPGRRCFVVLIAGEFVPLLEHPSLSFWGAFGSPLVR